jgi:hypothetical protein
LRIEQGWTACRPHLNPGKMELRIFRWGLSCEESGRAAPLDPGQWNIGNGLYFSS